MRPRTACWAAALGEYFTQRRQSALPRVRLRTRRPRGRNPRRWRMRQASRPDLDSVMTCSMRPAEVFNAAQTRVCSRTSTPAPAQSPRHRVAAELRGFLAFVSGQSPMLLVLTLLMLLPWVGSRISAVARVFVPYR